MAHENLQPLKNLSDNSLRQLEESLQAFGMTVLGGFHLQADEVAQFTRLKGDVIGLMVASHGSHMWRCFQQSAFYKDGLSDPLDRWTKRVLEELAAETGAGLALPFDRPYPPFQTWARRATGMCHSPLGILIHREYGLWFGLRGVFLFEVKVENQDVNKLIQSPSSVENPCDKCLEKPCLSHCPVSAFDGGGLNVEVCFSHLKNIEDRGTRPDCLSKGCFARAACPVGIEYRYSDAQLQFHMNAYYPGNRGI